MRKMTFIACAAMLTGAVVFTGCNNSQNNEPQQRNEIVKTEFSIAMPGQLGGARRMPGAIVQNAGIDEFQGMTRITLIPFIEQDSIEGSFTRIGDTIGLADLVKNEIDTKTSRAKVYEDVNIPLATSSFLFYAKSAASNSNKFNAGSLIPSTAGLPVNNTLNASQPSAISFNLEPILGSTTPSALTVSSAKGGKLLKYLTSIATAKVGTKFWYQYSDAVAAEASMKAIFDTLTTTRALSSFEVERIANDLYNSLLTNHSPMAEAIKDSIDNNEVVSINGTTHKVTLVAALQNFPQDYNIPQGSINSKWNSASHQFAADYTGIATLDRYVYPAQLWYYVNSTIQTANSSRKSLYEVASNTWATILGAHTDGVSVSSMTRAIAIKDQIQYGVARLDVAVRLKEASMEDNSDKVSDAVPVDCTDGLPITAILVGGQRNVGYNFCPLTTGVEYTIYDTVMASNNASTPAQMLALPSTTTWSAFNHTLVLENGNQDVMIAVEMVNTTGKDFYGAAAQLIPAGGKFYVVGKLVAADATETNGHVFKQDYKTTAKLTLLNLRSAYNTIPDLRTPQLELGFSVNLDWEAGHVYEINF